jgi:protein TonB
VPTGPLRIGGDVTAPVLVHRVQPVYPPMARSSRITGVVQLEAVIRRDGSVGNIKVLRGVRGGLTEAAIDAVKQWRYQPGLQRGTPVDVYMNVKVSFELS